ncbi:MAG: isochorismate synthase [Prevotella sp.]|nr:isochorismate synthase [Prevotella sp.]
MSSYAYYRLPRANSYTRITQLKGEPEQLLSLTALNGREGFVVAPFAVSEAEPILLIRADEVVTCEELGVRRGGDYKSPSTERGEKTQHLEKVDQDYLLDFLNFHAQLQQGTFRKIVLSRQAVEPLPDSSAEELFFRACHQYPRLFVALVSTPVSGTWLMATPEILLEGSGSNYHTIALAGTMRLQGEQLQFDQQPQPLDMNAITWSTKNIQEQRYVATYLMETLEHFSHDISEEGPLTVRAGNLVHLRSDFSFRFEETERLGRLLQALHPTPAVCGLPKREAFNFICRNEQFPRHYYSGFIGPLSPQGETHLYVSLRCMKIESDCCRLFAGGGLMRDSRVEQEWAETEAKMETMRNLFV